MSTLRAFACVLVVVAAAGSAAAQQPVPDATLQALRGHTLCVQLAAAPPIVGELVGWDATTMTLALSPTRDIVTVARSGVTALRLADAAPASPSPSSAPSSSSSSSSSSSPSSPSSPASLAAPSAPSLALVAAAPERERNVGLQLGLAPALMIDFESGHFYGFVNADVVMPMASSGDLLGFGIGAGGSLRVIAGSRWRLDIFAHFTPARYGSSDWNIGGGVGLGMHYTARNGFTLGFKLPILGYSGWTGSTTNSAGSDVGFYYLSALMGLPVISLGYRF